MWWWKQLNHKNENCPRWNLHFTVPISQFVTPDKQFRWGLNLSPTSRDWTHKPDEITLQRIQRTVTYFSNISMHSHASQLDLQFFIYRMHCHIFSSAILPLKNQSLSSWLHFHVHSHGNFSDSDLHSVMILDILCVKSLKLKVHLPNDCTYSCNCNWVLYSWILCVLYC